MSSSIKRTLEEWCQLKKIERRRKLKEKIKSDRELIEERVRKYEVTFKAQNCVQDMEYLFQKMESTNMWEEVLRYVTDPSDVTSAFFTCKTFSKHLEQWRMTMMLPKVFEILREGKYLNYHSDRQEKKGILSMRRASKSWRKSTDEKFLHHSVLKNQWYMSLCKNPGWNWNEAFPLSLEFKNVGDIDFAMKTLTIKGLSRTLIIRSLQVSYERIDFVSDYYRIANLKEFYSKLYQFLGIYGKYIWALHYTTPKDSAMIISVENNYKLLYRVIKHLPELKALILNTFDWEGCDVIQRESLLQLVRRFPFKRSLQYFGFNSSTVDIKRETCVTEILMRCRDLKAVSLGNCFKGANDEMFCVMAAASQKLERLEYHSYCPETLRSLGRLRIPLKEIKLCDSKTRDAWIIASELFFILNTSFGNSLEALHVETKMRGNGRPVVIQLPNLEVIKLNEIVDGEWSGKGIEISFVENSEVVNSS